MKTGRGRRLTIATALGVAVALSAPGTATGDGLPVPGGVDTTSQGVVSADGSQRFLAVAQGDTTLLERVDTTTGELQNHAWLIGEYSVPGVSIVGDTSGLSHDGSALVLIKPRRTFPQKETSMLVLDPERLRSERQITLDGDFSFDAISPDGRTAFLIEYPDPKDPTDYQLRKLDLTTGDLDPDAILPQNEPGEEMRGFPLSRASGPGGRWDYTLYDGGEIYRYGPGEGEPFVHAIDTVEGVTLCIDVEFIPKSRLGVVTLEMSEDGSAVEIVDPERGALGSIDVETGEATAAGEEATDEDPEGATAGAGSEEDGGGGDAASIGLGAGALALLIGGTTLWFRRRASHPGPPTPSSVPPRTL